MTDLLIPVILAGGSGTRLWPLSRTSYPKQFVNLVGDKSLFMGTVERLEGVSPESPIVVGNEEHRFLIAEQLRLCGFEQSTIVLEPAGRNTAPAIALAALAGMKNGQDPLLLIAPSDHVIGDNQIFADAVTAARTLADAGKVVTFGIEPSRPDKAYGYIKRANLDGNDIEAFVEKPDSETAKSFMSIGGYLWNSGIFLIKASTYLDELAKHAPDILESCKKSWESGSVDGEFLRPEQASFAAARSESIDYAVLEKTSNVAVVPMACQWSDLGSWDSIWAEAAQDENGNVLVGDVRTADTENCYLRSGNRLLTTLGCKNLIVVDTGDALLVAEKSHAQNIKVLVDELRQSDRTEVDIHARVYRPWGDYEGIDRGDRYQVKRIVVRPGEQLSLQKHHHRAEHWIVVKGTAIVTCGSEERLLTENQSTYIPLGEIHRLENPGAIPLELIEVQSGSYLGEDDIVRFEDKYGRTPESSS